jgi:multidrug resistance efflux pump
MARLEKLERDMEQARRRITEYQVKLKELEGALREQENLQIVEAVRALKLTRAQLREFIKGGVLPTTMSEAAAVPASRYQKKGKAIPTEADTKLIDSTDSDSTDSESEVKTDED